MNNVIKDSKRLINIFKTVFITGFLTHGFMFFNKISFHDDAFCIYQLGGTVTAGRWGLEVIQQVILHTVGKYSIPLVEGTVSLFYIGLTVYLIADLFNISNKIDYIFVSILLVVFPVTTSIFFYMFTAGCYFFALFLSVFSIWLTERCNNVLGRGISVLCIAFSLGVYQAFFPITVTVSVLLLLYKCKNRNTEYLLKNILKYGCVEVLGLILYLFLVQVSLYIYKVQLGGYQGIDSMMTLSIGKRIGRIPLCYLTFAKLLYCDVDGLSNSIIIRICIVFVMLLSLYLLIQQIRKFENKVNQLVYIALILILPICMNLIYLLSNEHTNIVTLVRFPLIFIFLLPFIILNKDIIFCKNIKILIYVCSTVAILYYGYMDNVAYFKADLLCKQTTSYYNVLLGQIKNCKGYSDEFPVVVIGENRISDQTLTVNNINYNIKLPVVEGDLADFVNNYAWKSYLSNYMGYSPNYINEEEIEECDYDIIDAMPIYPKYGSIAVINNRIVLKFADVNK